MNDETFNNLSAQLKAGLPNQMTPTPSQIQRMVAETLGWTRGYTGYIWLREVANAPSEELMVLPAFHESWDACAEFEKDAPEEYWLHLAKVVLGLNLELSFIAVSVKWTKEKLIAVARATPLQRCEAFLRWKGVIQ